MYLRDFFCMLLAALPIQATLVQHTKEAFLSISMLYSWQCIDNVTFFQTYPAQVFHVTMAEVAQILVHSINVHVLLDIMVVDVRIKVYKLYFI